MARIGGSGGPGRGGPAQDPFHTTDLSLAMASSILLLDELRKLILTTLTR